MSGQPSDRETAHPGRLKSFQRAEKHAREVLRERGYSEEQIEAELRRAKRKDQLN